MSARRLYNLPEPAIRSARDTLLSLLSDLGWHHNRELRVAGVRYSARLLELKRLGYQIERRAIEGGHEYRLVSLRRQAPKEKMVKVFLVEADASAIVERRAITDTAMAAIRDALGSFMNNRDKL